MMSRTAQAPELLLAAMLAATLTAFGPGCALVMDADFDRYHAAPPAEADGGGGSGGTSGEDASDGSSCALRLVINELQTAGPAGADDEFVEIYNAGDCEADLTGLQLVYRSSSATDDHAVSWSADDGVHVAPGFFYVVGGATWAGVLNSKFPAGLALGATGGGLALRVGGDELDKLGWGDATNEFVNQLAAVAPASGLSIARHPDGRDTNDDMGDLAEGIATPGVSNGTP